MTLRIVWKPSQLWDGRRWDMIVDGVHSGRVVQFENGHIEASVWLPAYTKVPSPAGSYRSLAEAARALVEWWQAHGQPSRRRRRKCP